MRTHTITRALGAIACLSLLAACETVDSTDVLTSGMYADIDVVANGSGNSVASAVLRVGGGNSNVFVDLIGDDALSVSAGDETKELEKKSIGDYREYVAEFEIDSPDTLFDIAFTRAVDEGAASSTVSLPEKLEIIAPEANTTFSRSEDTITWTYEPSGLADQIRYSIDGDCIYSESGVLEGDPGTFTIQAAVLEPVDEEDPGTCDVVLKVERVRAGSLDAGYGEGGVIEARQVRELKLVTAP